MGIISEPPLTLMGVLVMTIYFRIGAGTIKTYCQPKIQLGASRLGAATISMSYDAFCLAYFELFVFRI